MFTKHKSTLPNICGIFQQIQQIQKNCWLAGWLAAGQLAGWLAGCPAGWPAGWIEKMEKLGQFSYNGAGWRDFLPTFSAIFFRFFLVTFHRFFDAIFFRFFERKKSKNWGEKKQKWRWKNNDFLEHKKAKKTRPFFESKKIIFYPNFIKKTELITTKMPHPKNPKKTNS